jgi:predicted dithiol-disulfide oxidoreductase (DUF899 family)
MGKHHDQRFPGESEQYRRARDELTDAEMDLRRRVEAVAAKRRTLPRGGRLKEDYAFDECMPGAGAASGSRTTRFSELIAAEKPSLVIYSFMYAPQAGRPCPMCTSLLDALDGAAQHIRDRINLAVVAKAPADEIAPWAKVRGWRHLRLLSSGKNSYNTDYGAETADGSQWPAINVFTKTAEGVFHFYNAELFYAKSEPGQHPRHADLIWPLWSVFDLTPDGRGSDWLPKLSYS